MPKKNYYGTSAQIRKRKANFQKTKTLALLFACLLFVVFLAGVGSGFLTVGTVSFGSLFSSKNTVQEQTMYVLSMDRFSDKTSAENMAEVLALQGASAFLWESNGWYEIVGNVYPNKTDAETVKSNIIASNPNVKIVTITYPKLSLNQKNLTKEQQQLLYQSVTYLGEVAEKLYGYALDIETKAKTPTTVSGLVNNLKSECNIRGNQLDMLNSVTICEQAVHLKNCYLKVSNTLNELVLKLIDGDQLNHVSKYTYVQVLKLKYDLFQILQ